MSTVIKRTNRLDIATKLKIIRECEDGGPNVNRSEIGRRYNLPSSTLFTILKMKNKLKAAVFAKNKPSHYKNLRNGVFPDLEEELYAWFRSQQRATGLPVNGVMLTEKAFELAVQMNIAGFKCSKGWLQRFKLRRGIRFKKPNTAHGAGPSKYEESSELMGFDSSSLPGSTHSMQISNVKKCSFKDYWLKEPQFSYFERSSENRNGAYCTLCHRTVILSNMGRRALFTHIAGRKHRQKLSGLVNGNYFDASTDTATEVPSELLSIKAEGPDDYIPYDSLWMPPEDTDGHQPQMHTVCSSAVTSPECRSSKETGEATVPQSAGQSKFVESSSAPSIQTLCKPVFDLHHKSTFKEHWLKDPLLKHFQPVSENKNAAYCTVCHATVSLSSTGQGALFSHIVGRKHRENISALEDSDPDHIFTDAAVQASAGLPPRTDEDTDDDDDTNDDDTDDPLWVPPESPTRRRSKSSTYNTAITTSQDHHSKDVEVSAAVSTTDTLDVEGAVPVQFEVITIPSSEQWRDLTADTSSVEPIATAENSICRLCIKNEGTVPIFQDDRQLRVLAVQIMAISNVKVVSSDGLPSHICNECVAMVHSSFNFKVQCEASDATLRAMLVLPTAPTQDVGSSITRDIASVSTQLNETQDKLNTLVTSMKDLQRQYNSSLRRSQPPVTTPRRSKVPVISLRRVQVPAAGPRRSQAPVASPRRSQAPVASPCRSRVPDGLAGTESSRRVEEVMDISDDTEDCKGVVEIQDFKGFSLNPGGLGISAVQTKLSQHRNSVVGFSGVPCYVVELDSDSECEEICGSTGVS